MKVDSLTSSGLECSFEQVVSLFFVSRIASEYCRAFNIFVYHLAIEHARNIQFIELEYAVWRIWFNIVTNFWMFSFDFVPITENCHEAIQKRIFRIQCSF